MRLALKKTPRPGFVFPVISHAIGKRLDHSPYSHVEVVFGPECSASSVIGEGVRFKPIKYSSGAWDFITLPDRLEAASYYWYVQHLGEGYDYFNMLRFGFGVLSETENKWACTESAAASFGWRGSWRYGPGGLLERCLDEFNSEFVETPW